MNNEFKKRVKSMILRRVTRLRVGPLWRDEGRQVWGFVAPLPGSLGEFFSNGWVDHRHARIDSTWDGV